MAAPERETVIVTRTLAALPAFEAAINGDTYFRILADGTLLKRDGTGTLVPISAANYQTVAEEGVPLTPRATLNFIGSAITAADNAGQARTDVTVTVPTPKYQVIQEEALPLTARDALNFIGSTVTAADDAANNRTNITIATPATPSYQVVEDEGTPLTARSNTNFVGAGVTATDSGGKTVVTIPGGGAAFNQTIQEEGSGLTQRPTVNFIGPQVTAADDAGNTRTNVTIAREVHYVEHTFNIKTPTATTFLGFNVFLASGETKKLAKVRATVDAGTTLTYKLQRNAADVTGFGTTGSPLASSTAGTTTDPADVTLSDADRIGLTIVNAGTATEVAVTVAIEVS